MIKGKFVKHVLVMKQDIAEKWENLIKQKINSKDFQEFVKLGEGDDYY